MTFLIKVEQPKHKRVAIIDGDPIVYRIGFACQKTIYECEGKEFIGKTELNKYLDGRSAEYTSYISVESEANAFHSVNILLDSILEETESGYSEIYLTGTDNFRIEVAKTVPYKGNRDNLHKPLLYPAIREYLIRRHNAVVVDGMEADDMVAIRHTEEEDSVICTIDKDLDMVPGLHYNYAKGNLYLITEQQGMKSFYVQMLTGDNSDNIQGIPRIGKATANKLLADCETEEECYEVVASQYEKAFGKNFIERIAENGALLWMKRSLTDQWTPPIEA